MTGQFLDPAERYLLGDRIAAGGMGVVWRATDTLLGRDVAAKVLKAEYADDATFRARFADEARHAAALHHPGICAVYDVGEAPATAAYPPRPFLVMELVEGQPLNNLLRPDAPMDPAVVRDLMGQAADALGAAHAAGIVHRDVKPGNLLVTPDRRVKITDFGIARAAEQVALTRTGQVMGTPQYLSPEQAQGLPATPASDVYSLACVAYECLAGRKPFDAETAVATALAHVREPVPVLPSFVPSDLATVVTRGLAKDPAARYPDGTAFAAALRDPAAAVRSAPVVTGEATQVVPAQTAETAPATAVLPAVPHTVGAPATTALPTDPGASHRDEHSSGQRWTMFVIAALAAALLAGLVWLMFGNDGSDDAPPTDEPTSQGPSDEPTDEGIVIDSSRYEGRQVDDVARELGNLGLLVRRQPVPNPGDQTPGVVTGVNPTGSLEKGDEVTVSFYGAVPDEPTEDPTTEPPTTEPTTEPTTTPPTTQPPTQAPTTSPEQPTTDPGAQSDPGTETQKHVPHAHGTHQHSQEQGGVA